jgi:hypothetical protein
MIEQLRNQLLDMLLLKRYTPIEKHFDKQRQQNLASNADSKGNACMVHMIIDDPFKAAKDTNLQFLT